LRQQVCEKGALRGAPFSLPCGVSQSRSAPQSSPDWLGCRSSAKAQPGDLDASFKENDMLSKSKFLKTTILAALIGLAAAAAATPASAHEYDRHGGYSRDRDSDRGDRGDRGDRHGRHDRGDWGWGHRHSHRHHGWY
jgi:hypothetical protein